METKLKPLQQWICDSCGEIIEKPEHGFVEWKTNRDMQKHGFRIIHHFTHSRVKSDDRCYYSNNERGGDTHLAHFLGEHGRIVLLSLLDPGEELVGAMREEFITDKQGRRVRAKHVAKMPGPDGEQIYLWDDIRTMSRQHMLVSAQTERQQIASWCYRLKVDVDSFNENNNKGKPIQISFNFEPDMADMEALEAVTVAS